MEQFKHLDEKTIELAGTFCAVLLISKKINYEKDYFVADCGIVRRNNDDLCPTKNECSGGSLFQGQPGMLQKQRHATPLKQTLNPSLKKLGGWKCNFPASQAE